jgi:hypothetical protein
VTRCARLVESRSAKSGAPGHYLAERGTGLPPLAPYPLPRVRPPSSASLRTRFLTIPNTSCKIRRPASLRSEGCSDLSRNAVRLHPGTAFGFVGMPTRAVQGLEAVAGGVLGWHSPLPPKASRRFHSVFGVSVKSHTYSFLDFRDTLLKWQIVQGAIIRSLRKQRFSRVTTFARIVNRGWCSR